MRLSLLPPPPPSSRFHSQLAALQDHLLRGNERCIGGQVGLDPCRRREPLCDRPCGCAARTTGRRLARRWHRLLNEGDGGGAPVGSHVPFCHLPCGVHCNGGGDYLALAIDIGHSQWSPSSLNCMGAAAARGHAGHVRGLSPGGASDAGHRSKCGRFSRLRMTSLGGWFGYAAGRLLLRPAEF